jgi:hypothetical protein
MAKIKDYLLRKFFEAYWDEIRLFTRWAMHSGHCSQGIFKKDYARFISERKDWIEKEEALERKKRAIYSE